MFIDNLIEAIRQKKSVVCVGLDPVLEKIPASIITRAEANHGPTLTAAAEAVLNFNKGLIDAIYDLVPVVKPQSAFFEKLGFQGVWAFEETCKYAKEKGLLVIGDVKRGDIGNTAEAYAEAFLGETSVFGNKVATNFLDAVTVNPYMGYDSVKPFVKYSKKKGKGVFVLVKTSNISSGDFQDRTVDESGLKIYEVAGHLLESWGADEIGKYGYSSVGAVVGATYPAEIKKLREIMPNAFFLIPGYGAQGGSAEDVKFAFDAEGLGAIVNSSRGINYAYENSEVFTAETFADAARSAVMEMNKDLVAAWN